MVSLYFFLVPQRSGISHKRQCASLLHWNLTIPPSLWPDRELRKYHCLEVPEAAYLIFKGSRDEKLVVLYCKQLGINYKNLSDEEFRWLIRILKKSKKMGTPISQRKKR